MTEISEHTTVHPVQHVPGVMNPADIPTRPFTTPEEVLEGSVWQNGPHYLALSKDQWPFTREFMDMVPASELRSPRAVYGTMSTDMRLTRKPCSSTRVEIGAKTDNLDLVRSTA